MKQFISVLTIFMLVVNAYSQVESKICTWKNNAKSSYTFTHDDFGLANVNGIENYVDTITYNRGIKVAFGAVPAQCDAQDWEVSKRLLNHGHEIMNHSWNHKCGNPAAGSWCTAYGVWDENDFDVELVDAHNAITSGSGAAPRFYIYPFDQFITSMNTYLVDNMNYIGTRTGPYDNGLNAANIADPAFPGFYITRPPSGGSYITVEEYNSIFTRIDETINAGAWGVREFHGVQDGSWGTLTAEQYRNVCNYMKQKMDLNDLWVGTPSEVITYIKQRQLYTTSATFSNNKITVTFNTPSFDFGKYLDNKKFTSPVTVHVNTANYPGVYKAYQNGVEITDVIINGADYYVNVYPIDGSIELSNGCELCLTEQPMSVTVSESDKITLSVVATSAHPIAYQWYKNDAIITGATSKDYIINSATTTDAGKYTVKLTSNGVVVESTKATVTVFQSTNCGASICITYQPSDFFLVENTRLSTEVIADGNNLTYEWYKDNVSTGVVTSSYIVENVSFLNDGIYKVRISDGTDVVWTNPFKITVGDSPNQSAFKGLRQQIPGTLEMEFYDNGGEGIAYHDNSVGQDVSNELRSADDVEIETYGWKVYNLGYTETGEWLDYSVNIKYDGTYNIQASNSSTKSTGKISLYVDSKVLITPKVLPNTGEWHEYQLTDLGSAELSSGWHTIRLYIDGYDSNIDNVVFTAETITGVSSSVHADEVVVTPNPVSDLFSVTSSYNKAIEVKLMNSVGVEMFQVEGETNQPIDVSTLMPGVYVLQVKTGKEITTHRIVKK